MEMFFVLVLVIAFIALSQSKYGKIVIPIIGIVILISFLKFCSDFEKEEEERKERLDRAVDKIRENKKRYANPPKMSIPSQWLYLL